jgi:hypothetical protein
MSAYKEAQEKRAQQARIDHNGEPKRVIKTSEPFKPFSKRGHRGIKASQRVLNPKR